MSPVLTNILITCFFCVFLAPASALRYKDCGSALANISDITVSNCKQSPCIFAKGTTVNVSITFVPNVEITKTKIEIWGLWSSFSFPFPIPNSNGCKNSGLSCPLKPHVPVTYHVHLDVKKIYPSIALIAKWKMVDQDNKSGAVFCFEVGVKLQ